VPAATWTEGAFDDRLLDLVGKDLLHFHVLERLGQGGMGVVYRALDTRLRRLVALKVLGPRYFADEHSKALVFREARSAAAVNHPNLAAIYDVVETDDVAFLVMEYVDGESLREVIRRGALPIRKALAYANDIARAMARAHGAGIVHCDLKPENIMINGDGVVKILDFGIARLASENPSVGAVRAAPVRDEAMLAFGVTVPEQGHGLAAQAVGTPAYMAPEQARGEALDARCDVFAFGIVLFEMLTQQRPFDDNALPFDRKPVRLGSLPPRVPAEVKKVLARCLEPDRLHRYLSGRELAEALAQASASQRPRWRLLAVAGAIGVAAIGVVGLLAKHPKPPPPSTAPLATSGAPRRSSTLLDPPVHAGAQADAKHIYEEALHAAYRGDLHAAVTNMRAAISIDPDMIEARLRIPIYSMMEGPAAGEERESIDLTNLVPLEPRMTPHDRALFDAFRPAAADAIDYEDWERRVARLGEANPGDLEFLAMSGYYLFGLFGRPDLALPFFHRALEVDPDCKLVSGSFIESLGYLGRLDDARAAIDACLAAEPSAVYCLRERYALERQTGDCAGMLATGRALVNHAQQAPFGWAVLAHGLASTGQPAAAVENALAGIAARSPQRGRFLTIGWYEHEGRFAEALEAARAGDAEAAKSDDALSRGEWRAALVELLAEMGRSSDAEGLARDFLARRGRLRQPIFLDDTETLFDPVPRFLALVEGPRRVPGDAFARERASWIQDHASVHGAYRYAVWVNAFAATVETPDAAKDAIALEREYEPRFAVWTVVSRMAPVGHARLLAGDVSGARTELEALARTCDVLNGPIERMHGLLWLADARAASGDHARACEAYRSVVARWGGPASTSVTAAAARKRMLLASCAQ
jgi:eukaryotic-like serine/threonine-protein kinase